MYSKIISKASAAIMAAAIAANGMAIGTVGVVVAVDEGTKYEFEDAELGGSIKVTADASASGGKMAYMTEDGDINVEVTVPSTGMYEIAIYAKGEGGNKIQNFSVNGVDQGELGIPQSKTYDPVTRTVKLNEGKNTVTISKSWGWTKFDYMTVKGADLGEIKATQTDCCDPKATAETRSLMNYLAEVYGNGIISGQQEIYSGGPHDLEYEFEYLKDLTGHYPAIRGFDYGNFCCPCYGSDDGSTDRVIDWVKNKGGIATASYHLNVPKDFASYTLGSHLDWANTTYAAENESKTGPATDFSPSKAATPGTKDNKYYLQSLEVLATEFKKLEAEGIPVIWRPLHEAEGGGGEKASWFWWGKEGSAAYKDLWIYTYKTLTEDFDCHNLIWEWNSYNYSTSADWYPGDDYVDIIGYDKYNCTVYLAENNWQPSLVHNDSAISSTFYGIMEKYNSTKMVSMAENDCFSTPENLQSEKAGWLYFCTWYDGGNDSINFVTNPVFNTKEDTIAMYQSDYCITLDELPADLYSRELGEVTTRPTTTTVSTEKPSTETTTTSDEFVFEPKSYKVDVPTNSEELRFTIEGAPTASIGGGFGFGTSAADWTNLEWKGNADKNGKLEVVIDVSEMPSSIKTGEIQIWWSNVWNAATETATDKDCELVDYEFRVAATATTAPATEPSTSEKELVYGDANGDGKISIADATAVLQSIVNPKKYGLSADGERNADVDGNKGVTPNDALVIQQVDAGMYKPEDLPLKVS